MQILRTIVESPFHSIEAGTLRFL